MNKKLLYSLIASVSMASTGAYAATGSVVTTKSYVDAGLQYVYDVANGKENGTVKSLQTIVGAQGVGETPSTGLVGRMETVESAIGAEGTGGAQGTGLLGRIQSLEQSNHTYNPGDGIKVTDGANDTSTIGLDLPTNQNEEVEAGTYVYTVDTNGTGAWQALEVATTWDSTVIH